MNNEELVLIIGGTTISTSLLNVLARFVSSSLELGRSLGTSIRRILEKNKCK